MARCLNLIIVVCFGVLINGAAIDRTTDSYQNVAVDDLDIDENLIPHGEPGDINGLLPPLPDALNFYKVPATGRRESSYAIDNASNTLILKGKSKNEEDKLSAGDAEAMKDWTELLEKLMQNDNLHTSIKFSEDDMSVELAAVDENSGQANTREQISITTAEPAVETTTDVETFTTDDAIYAADEPKSDDTESGLVSFFSNVWDFIKTSLQQASVALRSFTTSAEKDEESTEPPSTEMPTPSAAAAAATLLAFEEPTKHAQLPSQEFEKRGRDTDSLLYGHGIV